MDRYEQIWRAHTGARYEAEEVLASAIDMQGQTAYEASKGRCAEISIEEAIEILAEMAEADIQPMLP